MRFQKLHDQRIPAHISTTAVQPLLHWEQHGSCVTQPRHPSSHICVTTKWLVLQHAIASATVRSKSYATHYLWHRNTGMQATDMPLRNTFQLAHPAGPRRLAGITDISTIACTELGHLAFPASSSLELARSWKQQLTYSQPGHAGLAKTWVC